METGTGAPTTKILRSHHVPTPPPAAGRASVAVLAEPGAKAVAEAVAEAGFLVRVLTPEAFTGRELVEPAYGLVVADLSIRDRRLLRLARELRAALGSLAPPIVVVSDEEDP